MMSWTIWVWFILSRREAKSFNVGAAVGEPVQGAFKGIGVQFRCQFQTSPVFPHQTTPFLIDTQSERGFIIVPIHEPDIAVDDLKNWPVLDCHVLTGHGYGVKGTLIFQPDFKAVLYLCVHQWEYHAFVLLVVPFRKCRSTSLEEPVYRVFPAFFSSTPYQFARCGSFEASRRPRDTFTHSGTSLSRWGMFRIQFCH